MGVMLYEMCMQKLPFGNDFMTYARIVEGAYDPVTGPYSPEMKELIKKCLTVDPSQRPTVN
jgi:serine/threonine protein kinase